MRDLSLHLLDIMENSIRAGAGRIRVTVAEDADADRLELAVEDDGPGLPVGAAEATDPFFTTKAGKRTGLGLSLLRATAEEAGGGLALGRSDLGGLEVRATMRLSHVDRRPLGDVPSTLFGVLCVNPGLRLECRVRAAGADRAVRTEGAGGGDPLEAARIFAGQAVEALSRLTCWEGSLVDSERSR